MGLAAFVAPAAVFFAVGGDVRPQATSDKPETVVQAAADVRPCCVEIVATAPTASAYEAHPDAAPVEQAAAPASRWRVVDHMPQLLTAGVAPEAGLQVRTILAARSISAAFPEILNIGGVRPDSLRWHPNGLALDVMIPNYSSAEGIALGDEIVAFVLKNADRFGLQDAIWRGVYYTPGGQQSGAYGHYDHVHITTTGGGYPTGAETYLR